VLEGWLAPLAGLGATTVIPVGEPDGSDHVSFYRAGLPGVMLAQDPLDYRTLTRHSNMDLYDRLQPDDLKQAAAVVAALLWAAATHDGPLPRGG
jgi:carboxypeptidase Q